METTLKRQIDAINERFDKHEADLKQKRKDLIEEAWKSNIGSGLLKAELGY